MTGDAKSQAAAAAFDLVRTGMCVGLGTGSTVEAGLPALAARVRAGLTIACVSTSERTSQAVLRLGIPVIDLARAKSVDLLIDGADQIAPDLAMIKGAGGALTREKKLAAIAARRVYVADVSKQVDVLGNDWLPLEVLPYGASFTLAAIAKCTGGQVRLRRAPDGGPLLSDNANYLADVWIEALPNPAPLDRELHAISGLIETGLFPDQADTVILSNGKSIIVRHRADVPRVVPEK